MALVDYKPESREIKFKGGSFAVEGLSLSKIAILISRNLDDMEKLFGLTEGVLAGKTQFTEADLGEVAKILAVEMPVFVAQIIAHASGDDSPEAVKAAIRLPAPLQIEALIAIGDLTFSEVGGVKKFFDSITTLLGKTGISNKKLKPPKAR